MIEDRSAGPREHGGPAISAIREAERAAIERLVADGVMVFDPDGRLVRANDAAKALLGIGLGSSPTARDLCDENGQRLPEPDNPLCRAARHGAPEYSRPVWWLEAGGEPIPIWLSVEALAGDHQPPGAQQVLAVVRPRGDGSPDERRLARLQAGAVRRGDLLSAVADIGSRGVAVFTAAERLEFWNRAFEELWEAPAEILAESPTLDDLLARVPWDFAPEQRASFDQAVTEARQTSGPVSFELSLRGRWLRVKIHPVSGGGRLWSVRDISKRRNLVAAMESARSEAEAERNLLLSTFTNIESGLVVVDESYRVLVHNCAFVVIWGGDEEWLLTRPGIDEVLERTADRFVPEHRDDYVRELRELGRSNATGALEVERADGRILSIYSVPLGNGRRLFSVRDLTAQRSLQSSLSARNRELAQALAEQEHASRQLAAANVLLADSDRLRSEFLANMSHELRTPLNTILGYLGLITDGLHRNEREARQFAATAQRSAERLLELINKLLDVARLESRRMEVRCEPVSLWLAIEEVCAGARPDAEAKGLRLEVPEADLDLTVRADPERLRQVLSNVIENAVKFTPNGGVTVTVDRPDEERISVEVIDTGIGIPAAKLDQLCEKFVQVDGSARRIYGGAGIGLALTRSLVELMNGTIEIASEGQGHGTTVRIEFPAA